MSVLRQQAAALPDHRLWVTHATTFFLILYNYQKKKKKKKRNCQGHPFAFFLLNSLFSFLG